MARWKLLTLTHWNCRHTQVMHKPILLFKYDTAHLSVLSETLNTRLHHHTHTHTHFPHSHTPFVKYYLSRWFSIFQWLTGTHILAGIFQCCEEGTCRAVLNMAGETHFTHVLLSDRVIFHQYSNICALSDVLCLCSQVQSAASSQAVSRPEENIIVHHIGQREVHSHFASLFL